MRRHLMFFRILDRMVQILTWLNPPSCIVTQRKNSHYIMKANFQNCDIIVRKGEWSMDAIFNRTSVRKYKQKSLKKEEIDLILKAAFSAPSARNSQPWQFIVVENKDTLKDLSQMTPYASFLKDAAMGIVVCADKSKNDSLDYCQQDLAAATENMLVEAKSLGIGSCWLGVYPNEERYLALNQYFKLPKGIVPMWMISFGYIDQEEVVKDKFDSSKVHYEKY